MKPQLRHRDAEMVSLCHALETLNGAPCEERLFRREMNSRPGAFHECDGGGDRVDIAALHQEARCDQGLNVHDPLHSARRW